MNSRLFIFILLAITIHLQGQNTFEYNYANTNDQWPSTLIEDDYGNVIFSFYDSTEKNANILKISPSGQLVDSISINNPEGKCEFKELLKFDNETFFCFGIYQIDTIYNLWFCKFDYDLNVVSDIKIEVGKNILSYNMTSIINTYGNIVLSTIYEIEPLNTEVCIFEISTEGAIIQEKYFQTLSTGVVLCHDLFQIPNSSDYYMFTSNFLEKFIGKIIKIDSTFNTINSFPMPFISPNLHSAMAINDDYYIFSSMEDIENKGQKMMGLCKMDMSSNVQDTILLGMVNVHNSPGFYNNLDFIDPENVYYGGFSNVNLANPFFSNYPTWLLLNKLDDNLNLNWQKFYGGDACYNMRSVLATQDGGCVMAGTRYDYQTQNQERDVYILKVNEDGILTWTYNFPETTKQVIVYPNPGNDEIMIKTFTDNLIFDLFDIKGNKILSQPIENEDKINTSHLEKGVYTFRIVNQKSETIETGKWIKK